MAYRSHSTGGDATATTMVIAYPAGIQAGDIVRLHVYAESTGLTLAFDKGSWTKVTPASGVNSGTFPSYEIYEYWARIGVESGNLTVSWGGASIYSVGIMAAFSGRLASGDPLDATSTYTEADPTASTAFSATGVTTGHDNSDICVYGASVEATTYGSWTAGLTERVEIGNSVLADGTAGAAGATGTKTATLSISAHWAAALTVLQVAAAATGVPIGWRPTSRPFPFTPGSPNLGR
jgi:hypothetical protein